MKKLILPLILFFPFWLFSCSGKDDSIKIVNWNVQTFFDGNNDGCEYAEFRKAASGWNREEYISRLKKLCNVLDILDGDIVILEEIENDGIIWDISNMLASNSWFREKIYRYACFEKNPGASIGCAILSRFELGDVKIHNLDIRSEKNPMPSMRPLIEAGVILNSHDRKNPRRLKLFVNHWKSKSGGEADSEVWRNWQENVLCRRIGECMKNEPEIPVIAAGDFNRDINDFKITDGPYVGLRTVHGENCGMYSPWLEYEGSNGSYFFRGSWEKIDHFFTCGKCTVQDFLPCSNGEWTDSDGRPASYRMYTKSGYSDHLPVMCRIRVGE